MKYHIYIMNSMTFSMVLLAEIKDTISEISYLLPQQTSKTRDKIKLLWGEEEGQQRVAVAKLMEATRARSQALTASTQLLGTDIAKHTGLTSWISLYR